MTRDEKSGTVNACMRKVRLGSLDIYSPKRAVDWRISVNMEIPGEFYETSSLGLSISLLTAFPSSSPSTIRNSNSHT